MATMDNTRLSLRNTARRMSGEGMPVRDLYPTAPGVTTAQAASAGTAASSADTGSVISPDAHLLPLRNAVQIGLLGNPLTWWFSVVALLGLIMGAARYFGGAANFSSIRPSFYNIIVIVLASIAGGAILKALVTRFPIPGITTVILAS
jgi:hypothetical protein